MRTQNFNAPLNSRSVPLQMFARGNIMTCCPQIYEELRKENLLLQREESRDIIYHIVSVEKKTARSFNLSLLEGFRCVAFGC